MSIPSGMLVERYREKAVIAAAFAVAFAGSLAFALFPGFAVALPSLFLIGIGMAMLQVAINPLHPERTRELILDFTLNVNDGDGTPSDARVLHALASAIRSAREAGLGPGVSRPRVPPRDRESI